MKKLYQIGQIAIFSTCTATFHNLTTVSVSVSVYLFCHLHILHIIQNKARRHKKSSAYRHVPPVKKKYILLEIYKGEPNNLATVLNLFSFFFFSFFFFFKKRTRAKPIHKLQADKRKKKKKIHVITLTVCNHANRNDFNLEENKETLEELRMSSFTELKSLGPWNRIENLPIFVLQ